LPTRVAVSALIQDGIRRSGQGDGVVKIMLAGPDKFSDSRRAPDRLIIGVMPARPAPPAVDLLLLPFEPTRWHAHKLTAYLDSAMLATRARAARCFDAVAVARGALLDTSMANLFLVDGSVIKTPPADGDILPGIARARLLASRELGIRECRLYVQDLRTASCVFLTNSVRGPIPVRRLMDERGATVWQSKGRAAVPEPVRRVYRNLLEADSAGTS
jgi:branched-subunit amino acid aminotransferase/4-amino-4-deoxychorismate lyase